MSGGLGSLDDAALAERLEGLSPAKRAFVEAQLAKLRAAATPAAEPVLGPRAPGAAAPLSYAQELLWLIQQGAPASSAYNVPRALRLRGPLDLDALGVALDAIVARHEILRTRVDDAPDGARQEVMSARPVALDVVDLSTVPVDARDAAAERVLLDHARRPFDLAGDQLLRGVLVRLSAEDHALLLVTHHVASDGSSREILFRELSLGYAAARRGAPAALAPLAVQYGDYAAWQRATIVGARLESLLAWWREHLAGAPRVLELPTDRPRTSDQQLVGVRRHARLDGAVRDAVVGLAQREQVTPFVVLLAAAQTLLHRWSRQADVVVGSVLTGRSRPELDGVLGMFSTLLPLRGTFGDDPTFREALARARAATVGAVEHAELPFEKLALELHEGGDAGAAPLAQVTIAMVDDGPSVPSLDGIAVEQMLLDRGVAKFDLSLAFGVERDALSVVAEYRSDLFDAATIDRLLAQLGTLLRAAAHDAGTRVSRLALLDAAARDEVLTRWNPARVETPDPAATLPEWILATSCGDAIAVECDGRALTYDALLARSERLARRLAALGVRPGVRVGVCMERSCELLVGLLGVLRAGGAYVPVDPSYPAERIGVVFEDAAVPVVLTDDASVGALPATTATVLRLDAADRWAADGAALASGELPRAGAEDAAYVLFTSGSTGRPKGVAVPHRALVNFLASMAREPGLGTADAIVAVTTISFDIAGLELWLPLVTGARIAIVPRVVAVDGDALAATAVRVTREAAARGGRALVQATPATWRLLVDAGWAAAGPVPNVVALCGGEAWPAGLAESLLARAGEVWNVYGPTETTIWSTMARVDAPGAPSLGAPLRNTRLYVLDAHGEPTPLGVPGELFIGGAGVAIGYLGRPDLTAERFVPDPFVAEAWGADTPHRTMYRTGDLVRRRADGRLEYLGRLDAQVKVRGHRVELEEIEAVLAAHAGVRQVVVAVHGDADRAQLVAHVVPTADAPADASLAAALRRQAAERLPAYMVPATIAWLDALPLTPNGKVDRRALRAPAAEEVVREHVAPSTETERALAAVWAEVLRLDRVGATDGFLAIGGHSLLAMRVAGRVRRDLGVALPIESLLRGDTLSQVAALVDERRAVPVPADDDPFALGPVSRDAYRRPARGRA